MNKKIISLFVVLAMLLACVPITTGAAESTIMAGASFDKDALSAGTLTASVGAVEQQASGPRKFIAAIVYCDADGQLLDFSAAVIETREPYPGTGLYSATALLTLEIPEDVSEGQYVKAIVLRGETLEPLTVPDNILYYEEQKPEPEPDLEPVYTGLSERYYTLDGEDGSIAIVEYFNENTNRMAKTVGVSETGTPFRLKDMTEGYVGFVDGDDTKYRLYNNEGTVGRRVYGYGTTSMLWRLEPTEDGKYYISYYDGGYMAIENGAAVVSETPYAFELNFAGESDFTRMTGLDGFKLLTEAQQNRIIEICTSVGAMVFPDGSNSTATILDTLEAEFAGIYATRDYTTAEEQRDTILDKLNSHVRYNAGTTSELNSANINTLPGGNAAVSKTELGKEHVDYIWDLGEGDYNRIDATYTGSGHSQTVKFYYDETGAINVQTAIEALARFPYEYRQFIQQVNVYVPATGALSYNCDGHILTVRVSNGTGVESMVRNFAHELGHSIEFLANGASYEKAETHWCHSDEWQQALADDIIPVSVYGSTNDDEGLAEFARLYFQCYNTRDRMIGLKQLYPNRYASFVRLLNAVGMETLY